MENQQPGKLVPALIGGGVMAILSSVPIINLGNCLCCMWVLLGGALAVWFYKKDLPPGQTMTGGEGAILGLLAGVFGALFSTLINTVFMALGNAFPMQSLFDGLSQYQNDIDPEFQNILDTLQGGDFFSPMFILFGLLFSLFIDGLFGLLGGIIGVSLFNKKEIKNQAENQIENL